MSYDLWLRFDPPVRRETLVDYLKSRLPYSSDGKAITYENADTGVYFTLRVQMRRALSLRWLVRELHFEINYGRPSYFALEADIELRALLDAFKASIEDPQMHGMGAGPYSTEGFLRGWTFGNEFFASNRIEDGDIVEHYLVPVSVLRETWEWNYRRRERDAALAGRQVVPLIRLREIDGRASLVTVWGNGMPIILPAVDYVLVGRYVNGQERVGLAPWVEVADVVARAGIAVGNMPLDINYESTPSAIRQWVDSVQLIDPSTLPLLQPEQLLDEEAAVGGQRLLDQRGGGSLVRLST